MFREEAPGVWVAPAETVPPIAPWLMASLDELGWEPSRVMSGMDSTSYVRQGLRWSQSQWHERNPRAIDECAAAAMIVAAPFLATLSPEYRALRPVSFEFLRYARYNFFRAHVDDQHECKRQFTMMRYLDECKGGGTSFPDLGYVKMPRTADWILFRSGLLHAGLPILQGHKTVFVTWLGRSEISSP